MAQRKYRTQILLEPEEHQALAVIAAREGRSVSEVVREIVSQHLQEREQATLARREERMAVLERIRQHREEIIAENGGQPLDFDVVAVIDQMRTERDERNLGLRSDWD